MKEIREAVEGWFEYCIEEGVLEEALFEAGFKKVAEPVPNAPNQIVETVVKDELPVQPQFKLTHDNWRNNFVQGLIPSAHFASSQLGAGSALARV